MSPLYPLYTELDQAKSDRLAKLEYSRASRWEKEQESALDMRADEVAGEYTQHIWVSMGVCVCHPYITGLEETC